ncbi:Rrf2 family transcriptional regulator [Phyllobacterium phragmitis]|uniref:Rrf2 family transcriptional regulator n=1 Tax=Phyllobacterium phragmitis TaxID=2670329 RepID=A0A2S9IK30_9HYPH|nr:Rrf2 family transcriptional regulator [Phyllobacterium phragmitis]PRD40891.1 Rrf2 family transcriptional regulator [Phyllobacterium phragmitis]
MKLTVHTDYGLRVLMTLAVMDGRLVTIDDLARRHRVSKNHLMKVVQTLVGLGLVKTVRGRGGGLMLAKAPEDIRMGAVVQALETDMALVSCLGNGPSECVLIGACRLTAALQRALGSFIAELDRLSLSDLVAKPQGIRQRLALTA